MTAETAAGLCALWQLEKDQAALTTLLKQFEPMAWHWARRAEGWGNRPGFIDRDDLYTVGLWALVEAATEYRADRGMGFTTWAFNRVRWFLLRYLHPWQSQARLEPAGHIISLDDLPAKDGTALHEAIPAPAVDLDLALDASSILGMLPVKDRHLLEGYFLRDCTYEEIGRELGITREAVRQGIERALKHARRAANGIPIRRRNSKCRPIW